VETRNLGASGLRVSLVGLGCNNFGGRMDDESASKVIDKAFDLGITHFDTADVYGQFDPSGRRNTDTKGGSEVVLGKFLGNRRKDIVLATKFASAMDEEGKLSGTSRRYAITALEDSLKRLKTDWIDLYYIHRSDPRTPIEETLRALDDMIRSGKVRYIAFSNFPAWKAVEAVWTARAHNLNGFIACQDEMSLLARRNEKELLPALAAHGLGFVPYYPLAGGALTGKYRKDAPMPEGARITRGKRYSEKFFNDKKATIVEGLIAFAEKRGHTLLELAMSWLASRPQVGSIIAGATKPEQLEANVKATGWTLTPEDLAEIDEITEYEPPKAAGG
jgi:aryl-alcohol dehydrogenase-like predicted oxidoreductase